MIEDARVEMLLTQKNLKNKLPDFDNGKNQKVFVVQGNKAIKRDITIGITGNEMCEIISGLDEGDVVISDGTNAYRHLNEIEISN